MLQLRQSQKPDPPSAILNATSALKTDPQSPMIGAQAPRGPRTDNTANDWTTPAPNPPSSQEPPPTQPLMSKGDAAMAPAAASRAMAPTKPATTTTRSSKSIPAVPLASPPINPLTTQVTPLHTSPGSAIQNNIPNPGEAAVNAALQYQNNTQAATAAVAAAMAKLPPAPGQKPRQAVNGEAVDNLATKVKELRTDNRFRNYRQPGTGGYAAGNRGGRVGGRGSGREHSKGLDVPITDFDFESANAKFNKHALMKEAIAGVETSANGKMLTMIGSEASTESTLESATETLIPGRAIYNKSSSFFDNISSETRDRDEAADGKRRASGSEFRTEERKKNLETFGMGSVESGHRAGSRGRGRGRGGIKEGRRFGGFEGHGKGRARASVVGVGGISGTGGAAGGS